MALTALSYMKLPDVPYIEHPGMRQFMMQLKRLVAKMRDDNADGTRVITYADIDDLGIDQPRWEDLRFPATAFRLDSASSRYSYDYTNCGINFHDNARYTGEPLCCVVQLPHSKKLGTQLRPHIHWEQNQDADPNWLLEWRWVNNGELRGTYQTAVASYNAYPYVSGNLQQITVFPEIPPILREGTSSILDVRLFRDTANSSGLFSGADAYTGNALLKEFDIHYKVDSFGSQREFIKLS